MAQTDKKYLDLTGLSHLITKLRAEYKPDVTASSDPAFVKVGKDSKGYIKIGAAIAKSDITALGIPAEDTNQTIKGNGTAFGTKDAVDIVAGGNISVTADTTNKKITIAYTGAAGNDNQKVKSGSVTFGDNDVVNIKADTTSGNPITVSGNATSKEITIKHGTTTAVAASACQVGKDAWGHVVLGSHLSYNDLDNKPTIGDGTLTIQANGTSKGTFKANATGDTTVNITAADLGLSQALVFIGVGQASAPTDKPYVHDKNTGAYIPKGTGSAAEVDAKIGDVFLYNKKEYVFTTGGKYATPNVSVELGDEGSYALKTRTINGDGTYITGGGDLTANRTLSHKTYSAADATAIRVGRDAGGHVVFGSAIGIASNGAHEHTVNGSVTIPTVSSGSTKISLDKKTSTVVTDLGTPATQKLDVTTLTKSTASRATAGTAVVYGTADVGSSISITPAKSNGNALKFASGKSTTIVGGANVGTAVVYGKANVGAAVVYGKANVGSSISIVPAVSNGTASKAEAGTAVTYGNANVGTATRYGTANVGTAVVYGTADVGSSISIVPAKSNGTAVKLASGKAATYYGTANVDAAKTVATGLNTGTGYATNFVTGLSSTAYHAEYNSTDESLDLTAITANNANVGVTTTSITPAVASTATVGSLFTDVNVATVDTAVSFTPATAANTSRKLTPAVEAPSTQTLFPAASSSTTITPYTFTDVAVATTGSAVSFTPATAAPSTQTLTPATAAPSTQTLTPAEASTVTAGSLFTDVAVATTDTAKTFTPAVAADTTRKITPYTFDTVNVASISANTTVATGSLSATGSGADVVTGYGTPSKATALLNTTVIKADTSSGDVSVVNAVNVGTATGTVTGTAVEAGAHAHSLS